NFPPRRQTIFISSRPPTSCTSLLAVTRVERRSIPAPLPTFWLPAAPALKPTALATSLVRLVGAVVVAVRAFTNRGLHIRTASPARLDQHGVFPTYLR